MRGVVDRHRQSEDIKMHFVVVLHRQQHVHVRGDLVKTMQSLIHLPYLKLCYVCDAGNSMYTCEETWAVKSMRRVFASRPSRTLALARRGAVAETGIPESGFPVTGAFNDVSLHVVTAPEVAAEPDAGSDSD